MDLNNKYIFDGLFGLERETLRVTADGRMALTPHPFGNDARLDRDFCENQLEIITSPCESIELLTEHLQELDSYAKNRLREAGEYLWMNSNPPHIESERDIPIAVFDGKRSFKHDYRLNLEKRYGKRLMLYSGIHFNFSFSEELIKSIYDGRGTYNEFKDALYFRLSKQVFRYGWLLVLLTAASPVYDLSLLEDGLSGSGFDGYASLRNSGRGYWNQFVPILDYTNLDTYLNSIESYVRKGVLFSASELYLPMRLKQSEGSGVNHIELRMFDINPLSPIGIFEEDLYFAHSFLIYLTQLPDFDFTPELQEASVRNHQEAAKFDLDKIIINDYSAKRAAFGLLDDMSEYFKDFEKISKVIEHQRSKLSLGKRYCDILYDELVRDFQGEMLKISKRNGGDRDV